MAEGPSVVESSVRCSRCNADVPPGNQCAACGAFISGNAANLRSGVRRFEKHGTVAPEVGLSVQEFSAQVVVDRGEELTAVQSAYVRRLGELETVARLLATDLAQRGLFTPRGRVRSTFSRWLETLDRWDRFAQRVGVERKARPVPTLAEYIEARRATEQARSPAGEREEVTP
jgi:hypothetical protein